MRFPPQSSTEVAPGRALSLLSACLAHSRSSCIASTATDSHHGRRAHMSSWSTFLSHSAGLPPEPWQGLKSRGAREATVPLFRILHRCDPQVGRERATRPGLCVRWALCRAGEPKTHRPQGWSNIQLDDVRNNRHNKTCLIP